MTKRIKTILLVDDDSITNFINVRLLKKMNIADEITAVSNGVEGIKCLEDNCFRSQLSPELILLDINMPVMDGFDFLNTFHALNFKNKSEVVIAVLTSSTNFKDRDKIEDLGIRHIVEKPLTEAKINSLLHGLEQETIS